MFLRRDERRKNGKSHTYWAWAESYRTAQGSRQRIVAYLGELSADEQDGWTHDSKTVQTMVESLEKKGFLTEVSGWPKSTTGIDSLPQGDTAGAKPWRHDAARSGDRMSHFTLGHSLTLGGFALARTTLAQAVRATKFREEPIFLSGIFLSVPFRSCGEEKTPTEK